MGGFMVSGVLQVSGFCLEIYLPSIPENRANEFGGQTLCDLWPGAFPPPDYITYLYISISSYIKLLDEVHFYI